MEKIEVGKITHYFSKIGVAVVELSNELKEGDKILIEGATTDIEQKATSMQIEHDKINIAKAGQAIGMKVKDKVRKGDTVYKIIE